MKVTTQFGDTWELLVSGGMVTLTVEYDNEEPGEPGDERSVLDIVLTANEALMLGQLVQIASKEAREATR